MCCMRRLMLDLQKLFTDLFDPQPGEFALVLIDTPQGALHDTTAWQQRRDMAQRWHAALETLGALRGFTVAPLASFPATGAHNADLPVEGAQDGQPVDLEALAQQTTLLLAMTQFSA